MSRLGKKPIMIPDGVDIKEEGENILVKGPKGELKRKFDKIIKIEKVDGCLRLSPVGQSQRALVFWGTYASHLKNMIEGVTNGFCKKLIIEGIGFKAQVEGRNLVLSIGFSHPVRMIIPDGADVGVEKNKIQVSGINKELVGQVAAKIRSLKKPEPYKGKGIRYEDEAIRRKAGKKTVSSS